MGTRTIATLLSAGLLSIVASVAEAQRLGPACVDISGPLASTLVTWASQASNDARFWELAARDIHGNVYSGAGWVDTSDNTFDFSLVAGPRFDAVGTPRPGLAVTGTFNLGTGVGSGRCSGINVLDPAPPPGAPACPAAGIAITMSATVCP